MVSWSTNPPKVCTSHDWGGKVLEQVDGKEAIGEHFHYPTLGIQVLSNVLTKANGVGGSLIAVVPEIDMVICMTCSLFYNPKARMELINKYILPFVEGIKN